VDILILPLRKEKIVTNHRVGNRLILTLNSQPTSHWYLEEGWRGEMGERPPMGLSCESIAVTTPSLLGWEKLGTESEKVSRFASPPKGPNGPAVICSVVNIISSARNFLFGPRIHDLHKQPPFMQSLRTSDPTKLTHRGEYNACSRGSQTHGSPSLTQ
jgi:hypothetical protein